MKIEQLELRKRELDDKLNELRNDILDEQDDADEEQKGTPIHNGHNENNETFIPNRMGNDGEHEVRPNSEVIHASPVVQGQQNAAMNRNQMSSISQAVKNRRRGARQTPNAAQEEEDLEDYME